LSTGFALFRGQKIVKKREKRVFFLKLRKKLLEMVCGLIFPYPQITLITADYAPSVVQFRAISRKLAPSTDYTHP
jgi:hypothetical protein